jgi:mannose-6-phosphate isomerase-like protein (cupin superfamily)
MGFETRRTAASPDAMAPDGSEVRILARSDRGSMAQFLLPPGAVSRAVAHKTVEELWYVVAGRGRMWRRLGDEEEIVALGPGTSVSLPLGTQFQFRCDGREALVAVGVTMPPWPGDDEAYAVAGPWEAKD